MNRVRPKPVPFPHQCRRPRDARNLTSLACARRDWNTHHPLGYLIFHRPHEPKNKHARRLLSGLCSQVEHLRWLDFCVHNCCTDQLNSNWLIVYIFKSRILKKLLYSASSLCLCVLYPLGVLLPKIIVANNMRFLGKRLPDQLHHGLWKFTCTQTDLFAFHAMCREISLHLLFLDLHVLMNFSELLRRTLFSVVLF